MNYLRNYIALQNLLDGIIIIIINYASKNSLTLPLSPNTLNRD